MTEVIIILVLVCVNTLLLVLTGNSIYSQNEKLEQEIENLEQEIKELEI